MSATKKQRIINCVSQLPYKIQLNETSNTWKLSPLNGNSALYSSLNYLSHSDKYEQIVVGWTGEITREDNLAAQLLLQQQQQQQYDKSQSIDDVLEDTTITTSNNDNPTGSIPLEADEPFYLVGCQIEWFICF